jgi:sulfite reductase beta subunit-like hemoprotein
MQRVKLPVGAISAEQVLLLCRVAERFGRGRIHLTTRGNIEIHWVKETDLPAVKRLMTSIGLTSRGACGGAVRGVTCSSQDATAFPQIESLARRIHRHFTGNTRFERLPKKFKIGIEANAGSKRHLIQDVGLVQVKSEAGRAWYDIWVAGGLGREPQPAFLLMPDLAEERVIPLIEVILKIYAARTPAGKRLKHLVREIGEDGLRQLIGAEPVAHEELPAYNGIPENFFAGGRESRVEVPVFAGDLSSKDFRKLAKFAQKWAAGAMMVTADQDIAFELSAEKPEAALTELKKSGFIGSSVEERVSFRICPGSHECLMGLVPTRDTARKILAAMGPEAEQKSWAISGCPNSCSQPQLADLGIVVSRLVSDDQGLKHPRFDLYQQQEDGFGKRIKETLTQEELLDSVRQMG